LLFAVGAVVGDQAVKVGRDFELTGNLNEYEGFVSWTDQLVRKYPEDRLPEQINSVIVLIDDIIDMENKGQSDLLRYPYLFFKLSTITLAQLLVKSQEELSSSLFDIAHYKWPEVIKGGSNLQFKLNNETANPMDEGDLLTINQSMALVLNNS